MVAPTYATDLTLIDDCEASGNYDALGSGAAGLNDETDYFVENTQCVSKNGFTGATKGFILNTGTRTVSSGDAVFVWGKQNNRNLLDTIANGGVQVVVGNDASNYDHFYVDGSNAAGGALAGWKNYAVDPSVTPSNTTGTPTTTDRVGFLWKILGSGSLKGAPNAKDVSRHGRELQCTNGEATDYATFDGAASFGANIARRWGLLTPVAGGYLQHGAFVMGTSGTVVDFRDSFRTISVLDDLFVAAGFNEFEIRNASSNVEWTNINITQLVESTQSTASAPFVLTLDVGTFTGVGCVFTGASTTSLNAAASLRLCQWISCGEITAPGSTLDGSSVLTPTVSADSGGLVWDVVTDTDGKLDNMTFSKGTNAHHAIDFGTNVTGDITLRNIEFTGFGSTDDANDSTVRFLAGSGSLTLSLIGCTVDGVAATTANFSVDDAAGITVTKSIDPVTVEVTVLDKSTGSPIEGAHVLLYLTSDYSTEVLNSATNASGVASTSWGGATGVGIEGWAREADLSGTDYDPEDISGTITTSGFSVTVQLTPVN